MREWVTTVLLCARRIADVHAMQDHLPAEAAPAALASRAGADDVAAPVSALTLNQNGFSCRMRVRLHGMTLSCHPDGLARVLKLN